MNQSWLWETDENARCAILLRSLSSLGGAGPATYPREQVAAVVDWGLRERYRSERYRRAYRALKRRRSAKEPQ